MTNSVSIGIVGLPNIGKSTLFNLLSNLSVPANNHSFCTIDPNQAKIKINDSRLSLLQTSFNPSVVIPPTLTLFDIAGLVSGASDGKGLGNSFLSHISAVDAIYHIVRAFKSPSIEHFEGDVNPTRDLDIVKGELIKKDLQKAERLLVDYHKKLKSSRSPEKEIIISTLSTVITLLKENKTVLSNLKQLNTETSSSKGKNNESTRGWVNREVELLNSWNFLTSKPVVYLVNVGLRDWIKGGNAYFKDIKKWIDQEDNARGSFKSIIIPFSAEYEKLRKEGGEKLKECLKKYEKENFDKSNLETIAKEGYHALNLIHFFTAGPKEVRCWSIRDGLKAPEAAGVIHGDLEKSFICAEVYDYESFEKCEGSEAELKKKGLYRKEGKNYVVKDGDVITFRSGLGNKR